MKTFIVAMPFFNANMSVEAYRLCYRVGQRLFGPANDSFGIGEALLSPGLDLVETIGVEPFTGGRPLFVEVNEYQLLMGVPANLNIPADKLICLLPKGIVADESLLARCQKLKELGYGIAMDGIDSTSPLFDLTDYVILDFDKGNVVKFVKELKGITGKKQTAITNIQDMDTFKALADFGGALYSGSFFSQPVTKGISEISPIKVNALTLLKQINEEDFELSTIAGTIGRDPSLSISLLRFINNAGIGMSRKIDSIKSAVAILGQKEVKRWATAALSMQLAEDRPNELTRLSLIRARFAENLAKPFEMGMFASPLFMAGLFSLLDIILQKPMAEAVKEISLDKKVCMALVDKTGDLYEVMDLIYAYEHANWESVSIKMVQHNMKLEDITYAFVEALVWYKQLLDSIAEG